MVSQKCRYLLVLLCLNWLAPASWGQRMPWPPPAGGDAPSPEPAPKPATSVLDESQVGAPSLAPPPSPPPWQLYQGSRFDATWLPGGSHGLGTTDLEFSTTLGLKPIDDWAPLLISPYTAVRYWSAPAAGTKRESGWGMGLRLPSWPGSGSGTTPDLPSRLYDLNMEFNWRPRLAKWLFADLAITPGLYTDFQDVTSKSFQMRGRGLAIVAFSPQFQLAVGGMYVNRNRVKFLPVGGLIWNPTPDTSYFLVFPAPKVTHRFTTIGDTQWWCYVAGEFGGGRWEVERADGTADSLDYTDLRVILGMEAVHGPRLKGHVEVGYVFARRIDYVSGTPNYEPDGTVLLRLGLRF